MNKKKVLYFYQAGHYPSPRKSGADRVFFVNVKGLKRAGYEVIFIEIGASNQDKSGKEHEFIELIGGGGNNNKSWLNYQYKRWIYPIITPGKNNYAAFLDSYSQEQTAALFKKYNPDLLFFENIRTFLLFAKFKTRIKSVICIHDLDYILNYGKNIERIKKSRSNKIVKFLMGIQIALRRISEKLFTFINLGKANVVYVISHNDYQSLQKIGSKLIHIGCPVTIFPDEKQLERIYSGYKNRTNSQKIKILHIGKLSSSHNQKGVLWFLDNCWSKLKNRSLLNDFEIHFIGSVDGLSKDLSLYEHEPQFRFRGFVDSLEDELIDADFVIVPPGFPTGVRTKIPEAMSWGLPVVTGYHDAFGVGIKKRDAGVLITDTVDDYVSACVQLIEKSELRKELGIKALQSWEKYSKAENIELEIASAIQSISGMAKH
jgi:hypothetical protein